MRASPPHIRTRPPNKGLSGLPRRTCRRTRRVTDSPLRTSELDGRTSIRPVHIRRRQTRKWLENHHASIRQRRATALSGGERPRHVRKRPAPGQTSRLMTGECDSRPAQRCLHLTSELRWVRPTRNLLDSLACEACAAAEELRERAPGEEWVEWPPVGKVRKPLVAAALSAVRLKPPGQLELRLCRDPP
jgi:hypothetical protein